MPTGREGVTMRISDKAFDLIVSEEVTSKTHYETTLKRTEWPGGASGVTVGIGYDLGQTDRAKIENDWRGRVSDPMLSAMLSASGVTGGRANSLASTLKSSIEIPWDVALAVHRECVVPRWEGVVEKALPNTDKLPPDCFGALVSLTFNRGPSFSNDGDRYREMRAIKAHMAAGAFDKIPGEFRAMKRIWQGKGLDGLLRRRDAEADLFQRGLSTPVPSAAARSVPGPSVTGPTPTVPAPMPQRVGSDLAHLVIAAMERKGYQIDRGPGEVNIVYVEGMNLDGTPNHNEANKWNDLRLLIRFEGGEPNIIGKWVATTEPGRYSTFHPSDPSKGVARIEFGQYRAWQVGMHGIGRRSSHEGLRQDAGTVTVCRDLNKDGSRQGDKRETGEFYINQHSGYNQSEVEGASAGCLVGQSVPGHERFMELVKSDPRYKADRMHVFVTAILPASDVLAEGAVKPTVQPTVEAPDLPLGSIDGSDAVRRLQKLLGFSEEEQDGIFGAVTMEAVRRFQRRRGLTVTGKADEKTLDLLEREAASAGAAAIIEKPPAGPRPDEPVPPPIERPQLVQPQVQPVIPGVIPSVIPSVITNVIPKVIPAVLAGAGAVNPFIALAGAVLPDILKAVVGDKAGTVAGAVTDAVTQITQTANPDEARKKLEADPQAVAALQLKLAEIAASQEEKRQQAQLALLKEQNEQETKRQQAQLALLKEQSEQEAKQRAAQLAQFRAEVADTQSARATFRALALANNPMSWGAPLVSILVTIGFFGILTILVLGLGDMKDNPNVVQIVNITVGALAAAFATVVSFWLGSSQGSRAKDSLIQLQAGQSAAQTETLKSTVQAQTK
jgi:peptidoglycan hydrolase-like protein with peptidoglycan-binding domain